MFEESHRGHLKFSDCVEGVGLVGVVDDAGVVVVVVVEEEGDGEGEREGELGDGTVGSKMVAVVLMGIFFLSPAPVRPVAPDAAPKSS